MMKKAWWIIAGTLVLSACGSITIPGDDDSEVSIDFVGMARGDTEDAITVTDGEGTSQSVGFSVDDDGFSMSGTGEDGEETFSFGSGVATELHEDFPEDIPFPDSAQFVGNQRVADGQEVMFTVQYLFSEDAKEVYDLYRDYVSSQGYESIQEMESDVNYSVMGVSPDASHNASFSLTHYAEDEENMAIVIVIIEN
ncbi:hypothetical protein [Salisediminibacterium selenitireducens]|uniref:Lipoprotein n=1 Tax=Bacillus selenitireducens (strain ATCC 700615 / DSM 15326 / MLS10) TaxID=439292 RepID=D6Y0P3_BACIE|nr:hypothetical protein [Salisediminibacterium selenitireducens]ADI00611.1 hypothetical protein Bsel_3129 [[Bacillus] selenitireducens MLS10]